MASPSLFEQRSPGISGGDDDDAIKQSDTVSLQKAIDVLPDLPNNGRKQLSSSHHEPVDTAMEVDERSPPPRQSHHKHDDEPESDDILVTAPPEGQPLRIPSMSIPRRHIADDDDDDIDELDIIGSLSPSHSYSEPSIEPRTRTTTRTTTQATTRTTTQRPSPVHSSVVNSPQSLPQPNVDERSIVDVMAIEEDEPDNLMDDLQKERPLQPSTDEEIPNLMHPEIDSHVASIPPSRLNLPQQPLVHSVAVEVPHRQITLFIPGPSFPIPGLPAYNFDMESEPEPIRPISPEQPRSHFNPIYNLPPLKTLPAEFHRKPKPTKQQRKREKEREKNERASERGDGRRENKEDWVPMGIHKWGATMRANPVYKKVARAPKCLSTREWNVCHHIDFQILA